MTQSTEQYKFDKFIWTENDFDQMNWHDSPIHAIAFGDNFKLLMDIDYIFEWVLKGEKYIFWIAPCTLVFENVYNLAFDVGPTTPGFTIDFVTMENRQRPKNSEYIDRDTEFDWTIEMQEGTITFKSVGFKQYVRQLPKLLRRQKLTLIERGGLSFESITA